VQELFKQYLPKHTILEDIETEMSLASEEEKSEEELYPFGIYSDYD
jgi:hypothetical protein